MFQRIVELKRKMRHIANVYALAEPLLNKAGCLFKPLQGCRQLFALFERAEKHGGVFEITGHLSMRNGNHLNARVLYLKEHNLGNFSFDLIRKAITSAVA